MRNDSSIVWTPMATFCTCVSSKTTQRWSIFAGQCGNPVQLDWVSLSRCFVSWTVILLFNQVWFQEQRFKRRMTKRIFSRIPWAKRKMTTLTTWKNHGGDVTERRGKVYQNAVYWINLTGAQDEDYFGKHIPTIILGNSESAECLAKWYTTKLKTSCVKRFMSLNVCREKLRSKVSGQFNTKVKLNTRERVILLQARRRECHLAQNNYSFDALQAYCFGINKKL